MKGKFITFEGCEGVGKSTQLRLIKEYMQATGQEAIFTREPGGTPLAEKIRNIILTEEMCAETEAELFAAARCDHIDNLILPALREGKTVICDRYVDSSLAYQGFGRNLGYERVKDINFYAFENCMPDAVVFIDMNPLESWRRKKGTVIENDRMEKERDSFHVKVYEGFKTIEGKNGNYLSVIPETDKVATSSKIIEGLKQRGLIK